MIKHFKIQKGKHYCNPTIPILTIKHKISGVITFQDINYEIDREYIKDTNKIIGLSNNWHHHMDSVRIGWRMNQDLTGYNDSIEIMVTYYENDKRVIIPLTTTKPISVDQYSIEITKDSYVVRYNETEVSIPIDTKRFPFHYVCKPFFGGNAVAPKVFNFEISINCK